MATATPPGTYLDRQFAAYAADWADIVPGQRLPARDLGERLAYGMRLYQLAQDEFAAAEAELVGTGRAYDVDAAEYVGGLLRVWLAASAAALGQLAAAEADGNQVRQAGPFRQAVRDTQVSMSIPVERVAAQADRLAREGHTRATSTGDLRRELRRRMGA